MDSRVLTTAIFLVLCGALGFIFRDELQKIIEHERGATRSTSTIPAGKKVEIDPTLLAAVYERLKLKPLTEEQAAGSDIRRALKDLTESACDKTAIFRLSNGLLEAGEKRAASDSLLGFAGACPNSEGELKAAANILYSVGNYASVVPIADKLVTQRPEVGDYYYLRAQAFVNLGRHEEAIDDYVSTIALFDDVKQARSEVFTGLAAAYATTSKYCQAMTAIQTYVYADIGTRDSAPARKLIDDYALKGNCETGYARGSHVIPRTQRDVIVAKVSVNGVKGTFVIDTGASMVSLDPAFAQKAKVGSENGRTIMIHTANGISKATLTTAARVELGKVSAENVSTTIVEKPFGGGIDGLLGMSFLARFDVALNETEMLIQSRKNSVP